MAGDADFVPAAKLARTHGIDVMLDPLPSNVDKYLNCHIYAKKSYDIVAMLKGYLDCNPMVTPSWWNRDDNIDSLHSPQSSEN